MKIFLGFFSLCALTLGANIPRQQSRIVGGNEVSINDYPFMASVRIVGEHICGGSILNENTILTAAQCIYGTDHSLLSVRVGNTIHYLGRRIRLRKVYQHYYYNLYSFDYDLAVLKLSSKLVFSDKIQPISIQQKDVQIPSGTKGLILGWGTTSENSTTVSDKLRVAEVSVVSNEECALKYGSGAIKPRMMCAQTGEHDTCKKDFGGPLVVDGKVVGVVSWGKNCGNSEFPRIFTNVSVLHDWIVERS